MNTQNPPPELLSLLAGETPDFIVRTERTHPLRDGLQLLAFALFWLGITSVIAGSLIGPVLLGQQVRFKANGVPVVAGPDNLAPLLMPAVVMGIFLLVGLFILVMSIFFLRKEETWFAGTAKHLIYYRKRESRSINWEEFSGDVRVRGSRDKATLTLGMRRNLETSGGRNNPPVIHLVGIPNARELEPIVKNRISANDPTPAITA